MLSHSKEYTTGFFCLNFAEMQIDVFTMGCDGGFASASGSNANTNVIHTMWMAESGMLNVDGRECYAEWVLFLLVLSPRML